MNWDHDPPEICKFVTLARAEGFRPTSVEQGRQVLLRYRAYLRESKAKDLGKAGWAEYAAYKAQLTQAGISRTTVRCYLSYLTTCYRLRAQASQDPALPDVYHKVQAVSSVRRARSVSCRPLDQATIRLLLDAARGEDRVFLLTLLYTGGPAQFYGLRVGEVDFEREEIRAVVKGRKRATIPLHPALSSVLRDHLAARGYDSPFLFRNGKDGGSQKGATGEPTERLADLQTGPESGGNLGERSPAQVPNNLGHLWQKDRARPPVPANYPRARER